MRVPWLIYAALTVCISTGVAVAVLHGVEPPLDEPPRTPQWEPDTIGFYRSPEEALGVELPADVAAWADHPRKFLVDLYGVDRVPDRNLVTLNALGLVFLEGSDDYLVNVVLPDLKQADLLRPAGPGAPPLWQLGIQYRFSPRVPLAVLNKAGLRSDQFVEATSLSGFQFYPVAGERRESMRDNLWRSLFIGAPTDQARLAILQARSEIPPGGRDTAVYDMLLQLISGDAAEEAAILAARLGYSELVSIAVRVHGVPVSLALLDASARSADRPVPQADWGTAIAVGRHRETVNVVQTVLDLMAEESTTFEELGEASMPARAAREHYDPWALYPLQKVPDFAASAKQPDSSGNTILSYALMQTHERGTAFQMLSRLWATPLSRMDVDREVKRLRDAGIESLPGLDLVESLVGP